jgi:hypothetical protein
VRAAYGKRQLEALSEHLTAEFGKGFEATNLHNRRRFYVMFPIQETISLELSWSHYNVLARVENANARCWYQQEAILLISVNDLLLYSINQRPILPD